MSLKTGIVFALAVTLVAGAAQAADAPDATQKILTALYQQNCALVLDPTDKNFDAMTASMSPDFVNTDLKGNTQKREEVVANAKQQLKLFHGTSCDNTFGTFSQTDPSTVVVVATSHIAGNMQAPDGKHDFVVTNKSQDTWKLVDGKWLQTASKDLRVLVKVDGNVVQDQGE